jgi:CheY-like chemotaxis protein
VIPAKTQKIADKKMLGINEDVVNSVLRALDGRRTVEEVVRASLFPRFDVLRALYLLTKNGFLKFLDRKKKVVRPPSTTTVRAADMAAVEAKAAAKEQPKPRGATLMLLGNLLTYRAALASLLRDAGHEVIEEAAQGAVRLLRDRRRIDAVVLDVALDNPIGYDFCSWLADNMRAPIIVLSSDPSEQAIRNAVAAGASDYIVKPFTRDTILKSIRGVLPSGND